MFITPQGTATGSIRTTLWADVTGTLVMNGAAKAVSLPPGRSGSYTFTGTAGQYLGLGVTDLVTTPPGKRVEVIVYKPDRTVLKHCGLVGGSGGSCDLPALPTNGAYKVWVGNGDWATALKLWLGTDVTGALTLNGPAKVFTTARAGQNARYSFAGSTGQKLSLVLSGNTFPGITFVYMYKPDGISLSFIITQPPLSGPGKSHTVSLSTLPATGTYTVFITPQSNATGSISVKLNTQ